MKQPRLKIGEEAMDLLLALLEGKSVERKQVLLRSELIVRNSVGQVGR
jgi:LacI family repressor for deo operon, udp, cdd, tsx, nupC, and nupG